MLSPKLKAEFNAVVVALLFGSVALGWIGLVYLGLAHEFGPIMAVIIMLLMIMLDNFVTVLVAAGFAFVGAYAGCNLHWFYALLLAVPIIPLILMGWLLGLIRGILTSFMSEKDDT